MRPPFDAKIEIALRRGFAAGVRQDRYIAATP